MANNLISFSKIIAVEIGGINVLMPLFNLNQSLTSGTVYATTSQSVLTDASLSIIATMLTQGTCYTPYVTQSTAGTYPSQNMSSDGSLGFCVVTGTNSNTVYLKAFTHNSSIIASCGGLEGEFPGTGCGFILMHYGDNYYCFPQSSISTVAQSNAYRPWVMSRGATTTGVGLGIRNTFNSGNVVMGSANSASLNDYKNIGNAIMKNGSEYTNDPYNNTGSNSHVGGGDGIGLDSVTGEDIADSDLPSISATDTGLVSIYSPTIAQLKSLGSFLWSDAFSIDTFKKIFSDPWDAILGLSILGVGITGGTSTQVKIGNIETGVNMNKINEQFFKFDCGSITLSKTYGSYLDFNPYTKCAIYLPFIGTHTLNIDDIMGRTVHLKYTIDILSGACVANIICGGTALYSFTGNCSATIPLSGSSYTNMINGVLGVATSIGSMVATGGATAPLALPAMAGSAVNSLKSDVSHSGNVTGSSGIMGIKCAYFILEVPRVAIPSNQNKYVGYPSYLTVKVGSLSGFTKFEDIKISGNSHATSEELAEIETIMKEGVYI